VPIWPTIERFITEQGAAVLVTLVEARGSTPREVGARLVVRPDGSFSGTIGGGTLEWMALAEAQLLLPRAATRSVRRLDQALGPDLGQCCGGRVTLTLERFGRADEEWVATLAAAERAGCIVTIGTQEGARVVRRPLAAEAIAEPPRALYSKLEDGRIVERFGSDATPLYLFGAGHIGRSLILALAPLPFAVTWIDPRPSAFPSHVPENVACIATLEAVRMLDSAPAETFVGVMTHSHALDLDIVAAALKADRFAYVGLIGSATKRARFESTMRQIGISDAAMGELICPIGLTAIRDKAPAAIAASIAAQLLMVRDAALAQKPAASWSLNAPLGPRSAADA
jgi:xanthine dehydrogenase accessory factor